MRLITFLIGFLFFSIEAKASLDSDIEVLFNQFKANYKQQPNSNICAAVAFVGSLNQQLLSSKIEKEVQNYRKMISAIVGRGAGVGGLKRPSSVDDKSYMATSNEEEVLHQAIISIESVRADEEPLDFKKDYFGEPGMAESFEVDALVQHARRVEKTVLEALSLKEFMNYPFDRKLESNNNLRMGRHEAIRDINFFKTPIPAIHRQRITDRTAKHFDGFLAAINENRITDELLNWDPTYKALPLVYLAVHGSDTVSVKEEILKNLKGERDANFSPYWLDIATNHIIEDPLLGCFSKPHLPSPNLPSSSSDLFRGSGDSRNKCENDNPGKVDSERNRLKKELIRRGLDSGVELSEEERKEVLKLLPELEFDEEFYRQLIYYKVINTQQIIHSDDLDQINFVLHKSIKYKNWSDVLKVLSLVNRGIEEKDLIPLKEKALKELLSSIQENGINIRTILDTLQRGVSFSQTDGLVKFYCDGLWKTYEKVLGLYPDNAMTIRKLMRGVLFGAWYDTFEYKKVANEIVQDLLGKNYLDEKMIQELSRQSWLDGKLGVQLSEKLPPVVPQVEESIETIWERKKKELRHEKYQAELIAAAKNEELIGRRKFLISLIDQEIPANQESIAGQSAPLLNDYIQIIKKADPDHSFKLDAVKLLVERISAYGDEAMKKLTQVLSIGAIQEIINTYPDTDLARFSLMGLLDKASEDPKKYASIIKDFIEEKKSLTPEFLYRVCVFCKKTNDETILKIAEEVFKEKLKGPEAKNYILYIGHMEKIIGHSFE
jgi:hypothetical protein